MTASRQGQGKNGEVEATVKGARIILVPLLFITMGSVAWVAPSIGAALRRKQKLNAAFQGRVKSGSTQGTRSRRIDSVPEPVLFRVSRDRGLLTDTWINGSGPYSFAIDTGAGSTLISESLANSLGIGGDLRRRISLSGLSGKEQFSGYQVVAQSIALGHVENLLPANRPVIVSAGLPSGVDGILDPTDAFAPFGYVIDIPNHRISGFDCYRQPLDVGNPPADGAVIRWVTEGSGRRPFVRLDDGRLALLDTGSGLGLAVSQRSLTDERRSGRQVQDLGGGSVTSRRIEPSTVSIGSLTLRGVPTDLLSGVAAGTPTILGRGVLAPFRLVFDPLHGLIAISPAER